MENKKSTPRSSNPDSPEEAALADLAFEAQNSDDERETTAKDPSAALAEAEAKALRAQAELDNFRKRTRRERAEDVKYAAMPLIRDVLPAIDNLQRAITSVERGQSVDGLLEGVKMVMTQLSGILQQHHCEEISAAGMPFDPMNHEAVAQQPSADVDAGGVMEVRQSGYRLHDRVIRPAQVVVSQGPDQ